MFDKKNVLSVMNLGHAKKGTIGWVADKRLDLEEAVNNRRALVVLTGVTRDGSSLFPFDSSGCKWSLFYPASYPCAQEVWAKENNVEMGCKVRVRDTWKKGDNDYQFDMTKNRLGWLGEVYEIGDNTLIVCFYDSLPYEDPTHPGGIVKTFEKVPFFVLNIIGKPISMSTDIIPFKNKEEFFPHKDRWFEDAKSTEFAKVTYFDDNGVVLGSGDEADFVYYSELLSKGYKLVDGDIREYPGLDSKGNLKCLI